eukprot:CAMPEP_0174249764 /NCGR_PEP_ID=MMETSP0439-20130205/111_1 /TAXON_ID=0 /ORGANISM="Stereomyxa ramosa, Strain Chinc5" /LENGTH=169 /DNA_ID=CAMNT_0015329665 /DNA_START=648 /DNA_END=1158 /DNA_ORIENTATION=+
MHSTKHKSWFEVAIFTAAGAEYAEQVVSHIFGPAKKEVKFIFSASRCTEIVTEDGEKVVIKDLKKVKKKSGYPLEKILILDDTPSTWQRNYGNAIGIEGYWGTPDDNELLHLMNYLELIGKEQNVRTLDKRNWKQKVCGGDDSASTGTWSSCSSMSDSGSESDWEVDPL